MFSALIIDADGKTPEVIKQILVPYGIEFTVTENAPEAVNVARRIAPDLIFIRAELPITSGFSVCNRLRRHEQTTSIPLVIYSSSVSQDVFDQHRKTRRAANVYLKMPFEPAKLVAAIRHLVALGEPGRPRERSRPVSRAVEPSAPAPAPVEDEVIELTDEIAEVEREPPPPPRSTPRPVSEPMPRAPEPEPEPEPSLETGIDLPETRVTTGSGAYRAQREMLQLKTLLNTKKRELLSMTDELEERERAVLDAKRKNRELQAAASELESQLLSAQEQMLAAQEQAEALARDKQTLLRREEGLKNRLEGKQKKLKELEAELNDTHVHLVEEQKRARATVEDLTGKLEETIRQYMSLEQERDALNGQLMESRASGSQLREQLTQSTRRIDELEAALETEREERARELAALTEQHTHTLEARLAEHEFAVAQLKQAHTRGLDELAVKLETVKVTAREEERRLGEALDEARRQARDESERLTAALEEAEASARDELERLSIAMTEAEQESRAEIEKLATALADTRKQAADRAEQDKRALEDQREEIAQLKVELQAQQATVRARNEAGARAQQALAVALKLLEHHTVTS